MCHIHMTHLCLYISVIVLGLFLSYVSQTLYSECIHPLITSLVYFLPSCLFPSSPPQTVSLWGKQFCSATCSLPYCLKSNRVNQHGLTLPELWERINKPCLLGSCLHICYSAARLTASAGKPRALFLVSSTVWFKAVITSPGSSLQ